MIGTTSKVNIDAIGNRGHSYIGMLGAILQNKYQKT